MEETKGEEDLAKQLMELKEWLDRNSDMPKDIDDKMLRRFLHSCYYDMEKSQKTIETFTSMRSSAPELFADRDPLSPRVQKGLKLANVAQIPISGNRMLWIAQINDPGLANFEHGEFMRSILLTTDAWFLEEQNLQEGDVSVFDARHVSWKIFWKLNLSLQKKLIKYQEEAIPFRIKQMHMVNVPSFIEKLFAIVKPFMTKETSEMVHFHAPQSDTLFKYFSKDELPKDFGGNLDSLETYNQKAIDLLHKHRETLMRDDLWITPVK